MGHFYCILVLAEAHNISQLEKYGKNTWPPLKATQIKNFQKQRGQTSAWLYLPHKEKWGRGVYYKSKYESRRLAECCAGCFFLVLFHPLGFYRQRCEKCKERERGSPKVWSTRGQNRAAPVRRRADGRTKASIILTGERLKQRDWVMAVILVCALAKRASVCVSLKRIVWLTQGCGEKVPATNIYTHLVACFLVFSASAAKNSAVRLTRAWWTRIN